MNDLDQFHSGDLTPSSPGHQGLPQSAPATPDWLVPAGGDYAPTPRPDLPGTFFGVPTGATGRQVEEHILRPIALAFVDAMLEQRIRRQWIDHAANWFLANALGHAKYEPVCHSYDLGGLPVTEADVQPLNNFCNAMETVGADNYTVSMMLSWYWNVAPKVLENLARQKQQPAAPALNCSFLDQLTDLEFAQVEKRSHTDRDTAENVLRQKWGNRYQDNIQIVARYVSKLPPQEKYLIENGVGKGGAMLANDVDVLEELFKRATGINAPSKDVEAEIKAIEGKMNTKEYRDSDVMQARYRELIRMRDGG